MHMSNHAMIRMYYVILYYIIYTMHFNWETNFTEGYTYSTITYIHGVAIHVWELGV